MPTLVIMCGTVRREISVASGTFVLEGLQQGGFSHVEAPCGGSARCGRCLVSISGAISPLSTRERALLNIGEKRRLACLVQVEGDCTVTLPEGQMRVAVEHGANCFHPSGQRDGLGAAVDLGTTTVVLYLYDLETGQQLATASAGNAQRWAGADVISRIQYTIDHPDGLNTLSTAVRWQLRQLLAQACAEAGRNTVEVVALSVAGNTVMEHLLDELSPASIAAAPFMPQSLFGQTVPAAPYELGAAPEATLFLSPCVSGYVGGDIAAGLTAIDAAETVRPVLFIDVGTNGEIALGNREGLTCCSTAAGPAFEGASVSCGMSAVAGAIDKVWLEHGALCYSVLGDCAPKGLCGSGLVDMLAILLALGIVDETGRLLSKQEVPDSYAERVSGQGGKTRFYLAKKIWISAEDVRKLQLAKAAIAAGIQTLLHVKGVRVKELSAFYLSGGFGSYLRPESAVAIGLFPAELLPKLHVIGNSSGAGASAVLLSSSAMELLHKTIERCTYLELSGLVLFNQFYLDCMMFE